MAGNWFFEDSKGAPASHSWRKQLSYGEKPGARTYLSMVTWNNKLWLFGGFGDSKERFNDLYCFNVEDNQWSKIEQRGNAPKPIYLHSSVVYKDSMYVFGGSDGRDSNSLTAFDFRTSTWKKCIQRGPVPSPRYGHAACVLGNLMYVVGGCKKNSTYFSQTYVLNLDTFQWKALGQTSQTMAYHTLATINGSVYLYGGYNGNRFVEDVYRLGRNEQWAKVSMTGSAPRPRCGCVMVPKGPNSSQCYVFGGYSGGGHDNALYCMDVDKNHWERVSTTGQSPIPRAYLQAATVKNTLYIFGGYDGQRCVTDFSALVLPAQKFNLAVFKAMPNEAKVEAALQHFDSDGNGHLNRAGLRLLFTSLDTVWSGGAASEHPFNTSALPSVMNLGFKKEVCLEAMGRLHASGRDVTKVEFIVEAILSSPTAAGPDLEQPSLDRQDSERTALKKKLERVLEERDDMRCCKVCFENAMDCALKPCGHMAVCRKCASQMEVCPLCRKPIEGKFDVFWQ